MCLLFSSILVFQMLLSFSGNFGPYKYDNVSINLIKYNQEIPEPYNISLVTHPVSLHYGAGDILVTEEVFIYIYNDNKV